VLNLCDDEKVADSRLQSAWGGAAPQGNSFLDDQLFESSGDIEVLRVVTGELVIKGVIEPSPPSSFSIGSPPMMESRMRVGPFVMPGGGRYHGEVKSMGGMIGPVSHWSHFVDNRKTRWQTVCCPPLGLQWMASVDFETCNTYFAAP